MPEYNKPPPEAPKPQKRVVVQGRRADIRREPAFPAYVAREPNAWDRASKPLGSGLPRSPGKDDDMPRQMFGKVSSLSSLFENDGQ